MVDKLERRLGSNTACEQLFFLALVARVHRRPEERTQVGMAELMDDFLHSNSPV